MTDIEFVKSIYPNAHLVKKSYAAHVILSDHIWPAREISRQFVYEENAWKNAANIITNKILKKLES